MEKGRDFAYISAEEVVQILICPKCQSQNNKRWDRVCKNWGCLK